MHVLTVPLIKQWSFISLITLDPSLFKNMTSRQISVNGMRVGEHLFIGKNTNVLATILPEYLWLAVITCWKGNALSHTQVSCYLYDLFPNPIAQLTADKFHGEVQDDFSVHFSLY